MAWLYQRNGIYWLGTRSNGVQILKSTGTRDKTEAEKKLAVIEAMEAARRADRLNRDFFESLTQTRVEVVRLHGALDSWLAKTTNPHTRRNYSCAADALKKHMPDNPSLRDITRQSLLDWQGEIRKHRAVGTVNLMVRSVKAFFAAHGHALQKNPCDGLRSLRADSNRVRRQAFTPEQIRKIMAAANPFWRAASAIGFYSGLRLSDVAKLRVKNVDLIQGRITIEHTVKTGARVDVKIPAGLVEMIRQIIPRGAQPEDYIFPEQAALAARGISLLSGQFARLLVNAGVRAEKSKKEKGRAAYALSFHSWRYSFVSMLANSGANQQVVKSIVGHTSESVNDHYTHLDRATVDLAVAALPDITGGQV